MTFIDHLDEYFKTHPIFEETLVSINEIYNNEIATNWNGIGSKDFRIVARNLPEQISRKYIFDIFKKNEDYKGYVATMLWGAKGKVGDGGIRALNMSMTMSSQEICTRIDNIRTYLDQSDLQGAYDYLAKTSHIPYVGVAYFTKLLFFLSTKENTPRPLIYDAKLRRIHTALSIDSGYHIHKTYTYSDYENFLQKISELVEKYKDLPIMTSAEKGHPQGLLGRMEMILFSDEIQKIAKNYLTGKIKPKSSSQIGSATESKTHKIEKTNTAESQSLSLKVYDGSGANYGKTFQIINQSNHSPASSVFLVYQDKTIEVSVRTYNNGHNTLRKADTIKRFIEAHQLRPGQLIQCTFKNENECHKYIIDGTLPEQSE